jgi:hypothetical protein
METVTSLEDAKTWFLNNSSGTLSCTCGIYFEECDSYQQAVEFYESIGEL